MQTDNLPVYLSAREAARATGYKPTAVATAYKRGSIKPAAYVRTGDGIQPLFTEDAITEYRDRNRHQPSKAVMALDALRALSDAGIEEAKAALLAIEGGKA